MKVTNGHGTFRYSIEDKRWICEKVTPSSKGICTPFCFAPMKLHQECSAQARAQGATDADFGIMPEPEPKPKRASKPRKTRSTGTFRRDPEFDVLFDFT